MPFPVPRRLPLALCVLAALAALLGPLAAGSRAEAPAAPMAKGLQDVRMAYSDDPELRAAFWRAVAQAKVTVVRSLVVWNPSEGDAIAPRYVTAVRRAAIEGEAVGARLLVGIYSPINRKRGTPIRITDALIRRYGRFATSVAEAFADLPIAGYLTWNEPNFRSMWPLDQARRWVTLSNAGYAAFKKADPGVPVLVGEFAPNARTSNAMNPGLFLRKALCVDSRFRSLRATRSCRTRLRADGITLHTHDFQKPPTQTRANRDAWTMGNLRSALSQLRSLAAAKRISRTASRNVHITEFAYRTAGSSRTPIARAAQYLDQAWRFARREGIRSFTWYQLRDPGAGNEWQSGLQTHAGLSRATWRTFLGLR
ncbi:hypothetical protein [Patulibacter medicamentivorans]|uniref:hypothetical protein n=1 Tax=Patulibacter medicamentivorans TaxID=1097667 RepID=UPI0009D9FFCF|nr:hypothetical protein [Patulibacter medicamentivorans]